MERKPLIIGIDGGGTKTAGRLTDGDKVILAEHHGGSSNMQVIGASACADIFQEVVTMLCDKAQCELQDVKSIAVGLAGAGRASDRTSVYNDLKKKLNLPNTKITIVSDADIALEAAYGEDPGIIIIAGTGSIVYGRNIHGEISRMGGWGPVLGDPGSGSDIGLKALQKLGQIFDGRAQKSELLARFSESFGIDSPESLINKVYSEKIKPSTLTRPVFEAAMNKDENALDVLNQAAAGLADMVQHFLADFSKMQKVPITLKGGMLESDTIYRRILMQHIKNLPYPASVIPFSREAIDGAVDLALRMTAPSQNKNIIFRND
ncbi:MAG: BadF/BadG/BcrA/BcrD ATPase family protein [Balneolales bacterium]